MRKLTLLLLALALGVSLIACGEPSDAADTLDTDPTVASDTSDSADTEPTAQDTAYTFSLGGTTVTVGGDADALIASLGDPIDYMEAPSCVHEGYDKVYVYDGYSVTTSPSANGVQYVAEVTLTTDAVAINGSLMIGSGISDVEAEFGTSYTEEFGIRTYALKGATASVIVDGDVVVGITVAAN